MPEKLRCVWVIEVRLGSAGDWCPYRTAFARQYTRRIASSARMDYGRNNVRVVKYVPGRSRDD